MYKPVIHQCFSCFLSGAAIGGDQYCVPRKTVDHHYNVSLSSPRYPKGTNRIDGYYLEWTVYHRIPHDPCDAPPETSLLANSTLLYESFGCLLGAFDKDLL
ncbi:hypothetical protein ADUPG1_002065, partial [Aduncisulcus paluster]